MPTVNTKSVNLLESMISCLKYIGQGIFQESSGYNDHDSVLYQDNQRAMLL